MSTAKLFLHGVPDSSAIWRPLLLGVFALTCLSACQDDPMSAPYVYGRGMGHSSSTLDESPVTTELHTYVVKDEDRFRRFGAPLQLTFPKKYYGYTTNFEGGPQYYVLLLLDGPTLRPRVDVIRERYPGKTWGEKARIAYGGGVVPNYRVGRYSDGMEVIIKKREVYTDDSGHVTLVRDLARHVTEEFLEDGSATHARKIGEYCGFEIYDEVMRREADDRPASKVAALARVIKGEGSFTGINRDKDASLLSIKCGDKPSRCTAYISHRGFGVTATVDRSRVCAFMPSFQALPRFLDQHAAYPMPRNSWPPPPPPPPSMGGPLIVGGKKFTL